MIEPLLFAVISYFGWGVGDIFGTVAARKLGGLSTTVWSMTARLVIFSLYLPFAISSFQAMTWGLFFIILVIAVIGLVGFVAFNEGLKVGNPALVGAIAAAFPFVAVILSLIFLGERLTLQQGLSIIVIFVGLLLASLDLKLLRSQKTLHKGVGLGLLAMACWGIWFTFIKIPVQQIGWFLPNYIIYASFPLVLLFMRFRKIKLVPLNYGKAALPLIVAALLLGIAEFSYNLGITNANASVIAPIAGSYPTLFVILAFLIFKDPITKQQIVGIVTTITGVVLLASFTG